MTEKELKAKLFNSLIESHKKSGLIPVSWLIYDCPRYGYFSYFYGDIRDGMTTGKLWLGRAIHEKSFLKEKEIELRAEGIIGRIDEFEDGSLVEKKTTKKITNWIADHYVRQLEYYAWLLTKNEKPVKDCWLLFIQLEPPAFKFVPIKIRKMEFIEKEILEKAKVIREALDKKKKPPRNIGWLCSYCAFFSKCFKENNQEKH